MEPSSNVVVVQFVLTLPFTVLALGFLVRYPHTADFFLAVNRWMWCLHRTSSTQRAVRHRWPISNQARLSCLLVDAGGAQVFLVERVERRMCAAAIEGHSGAALTRLLKKEQTAFQDRFAQAFGGAIRSDDGLPRGGDFFAKTALSNLLGGVGCVH
jgi:hypothetical protein